MIIDKAKEHITKIEGFKVQTKEELEQLRTQYLGEKEVLNEFFAAFKEMPVAEKKSFGQILSELKQKTGTKIQRIRDLLGQKEEYKEVYADLTRPAYPTPLGTRHPISLVKNEILIIFANIGSDVPGGPEVEDDWHSPTALNLLEYHSTRSIQDTFFIQMNPDILIRTHIGSA